MSSITGGIYVGLTALEAQKEALAVTGENISNVSTPGYHRETANLAELPAAASIGAGVTVTNVTRQTSNFLTQQARQTAADVGQWQSTSQIMQEIQSVFNDTQGAGLQSSLSTFFAALASLHNNPQDTATRTALLSEAKTLAAAFQSSSQQLGTITTDVNQQLTDTLSQVSTIAQQIASLNEQIISTQSSGSAANVLEDQRSALIQQLSSDLPVTTANGGQMVLVGGLALVSGNTANALSYNTSTGTFSLDGATVNVQSGSLAAFQTALQTTIPGVTTQLNTLAGALMSAINTQHAAGYGLDGSTGLNFFTGVSAADIAVNPVLVANPAKVAASSVSGASMNGENAAAMAAIQNNTLAPLGTNVTDYYASLVGQVGQQASSANALSTRASVMQQTVSQQQQSITGVSLDAQAANMVTEQQAYQAAAEYIHTLSQAFQSLLGAVGG